VRFDVVIIGSGPAGCALAIHLRKAGVPAAIFTAPRRSISDEFPETLPPGVTEKDGWPAGCDGLRPQYAMASAWGDSKLTVRHAICNPLGHGWFVDRAVFDRGMLARATAQGSVPVFRGRIRSAERTQNGWSLGFSGQRDSVEAGVVVDASGRSSAFARRIGVRRIALDRLVCLSTKAVPVDFPAGEALVESAETGWWFSALNSSGDLSISFFTNPASTGSGGASFEDALWATIHTSKRISHLLPGRPVSRAARTDWLETPAGKGWLAIGDAAFASDPLGSQGLLRALETAEKAAAIVVNNSANDGDSARKYCEIHVDYLGRFLRDRKFYYEAEQRWPDADFWRSARGNLNLQTETIWPT
jgi:flavin-dependent dehydrogenase